MFLVDMKEGRIVADEEIKEAIAKAHPYRQWLNRKFSQFRRFTSR
jgi:glutamate synthase (ferredoxin)